MDQGGEGFRFTLEASQAIRIVRECFGQDLDRDIAVQLGVAGSIDFAHASATDQLGQLEYAETGARSERQPLKYTGERGSWRDAPRGQVLANPGLAVPQKPLADR